MSNHPEIVIAGAARTPIGSFCGALADVAASELGAIAIRAALERAATKAEEVDEVIMGHVLSAGLGQNTARQAAMAAGVPVESSAYAINQVCGSGLRSVALAFQAIQLGDAKIIVAGGQENMSLSPHTIHLRSGKKMGDAEIIDTMIRDGLWDAFNDYHMGNTAENVAKMFEISREMQDEFAAKSQQKAEAAIKAGNFADEITPVTIKTRRGETVVSEDEYPRSGVTAESLSGLRPAFAKEGSVTAGNASGLNDGACALVIMSADEAKAKKIEPLARIVSWASVGVEPSLMGTGPIPASQKALEKAGWNIDDLDLIEANEAFAAQACSVNKGLGLDASKVNVNGGAIALGHPIGASGARILITLVHEMKRRGAKRGLATLCIGGGMGIAMCVERDI